jgi:hypothetical protein
MRGYRRELIETHNGSEIAHEAQYYKFEETTRAVLSNMVVGNSGSPEAQGEKSGGARSQETVHLLGGTVSPGAQGEGIMPWGIGRIGGNLRTLTTT